ncbi:MAG: SIR2 family protein [Actinomycetota bacterium]|nr:SIR2 family protein [Actinomycetota bacterium]
MDGDDADHVLSKDHPDFRDIVDTLGASDGLTIVVGAGSSRDAGLPSWRRLLENLLRTGFDVAQRQGRLPDDQRGEDLARHVLDNYDTVASASIARLLHGAQRSRAIRTALYLGHVEPPVPGRIAISIAHLAHAVPDVTIVTTNYDDLIEQAIDRRIASVAARKSKPIVPVTNPLTYDRTQHIPVFHLHGLLPYADDEQAVGPIVLDEQDYALATVRPPGEVLPDLLRGRPVLFIGASMTDPNLVAAAYLLKQQGASERQFGLFVRESDTAGPTTSVQGVTRGRLVDMGIHPVNLLSYGQISQVLYEIVARRSLGEEYWLAPNYRYGKRFEHWRSRLAEKFPYDDDVDFKRVQEDVHGVLARVVTDISRQAVHLQSGEHLGLHLWVRRPGPGLGSLELWGSSVHLHRERWSLRAQAVEVDAGSPFPAVEAVYFGSSQVRKRADPGQRWQALIAVPIQLTDDPWRHLIVGVITLSSTKPRGQSGLAESAMSELQQRLHDLGANLLDPATDRRALLPVD